MTERPILFSGPMVRAILDGRKTQTRRLVTPQPSPGESNVAAGGLWWSWEYPEGRHCTQDRRCPYGVPGDHLWVRETWRPWCGRFDSGVAYQADDAEKLVPDGLAMDWGSALGKDGRPRGLDLRQMGFGVAGNKYHTEKWRPSIHMPRWASRLTLRVESVRVERLQDIDGYDARAEGVEPAPHPATAAQWGGPSRARDALHYRLAFARLWDGLNAKRAPWASSPWVWVVTFARVSP